MAGSESESESNTNTNTSNSNNNSKLSSNATQSMALMPIVQDWIKSNDRYYAQLQQQQQQSTNNNTSNETKQSDPDPIAVNPVDNNKLELKQYRQRLLKRCQNYISIVKAEEQSINSIFNHYPTRAIYICSIGASCGCKYNTVYSLFSQYGVIDELIMIGLSPFIIIIYSSVESAILAKSEWHQQPAPKELLSRLIFIEYCNELNSNIIQNQQHRLQLPNSINLQQLAPFNTINNITMNQYLELSIQQQKSIVQSINKSDSLIPGMLLITDFISITEELELLQFIRTQQWHNYKFRSVQHYGFEFDYEINNIHLDKPQKWNGDNKSIDTDDNNNNNNNTESPSITTTMDNWLSHYPAIFHSHLKRLQLIGTLPAIAAFESDATNTPTIVDNHCFRPNQLTINRYSPGAGIPPHVDIHSPFTDIIVSISLGSDIVMDIVNEPIVEPSIGTVAGANPNGTIDNSNNSTAAAQNANLNRLANNRSTNNILLPARSLLILAHQSRYAYTHAIMPRKTDRLNGVLTNRNERISLTYRKLRSSVNNNNNNIDSTPLCQCNYPHLCDSYTGKGKKDKRFVPSSRIQSGISTTTTNSSTHNNY